MRVEPLGTDRHDRRYWWFRCEPRCVFAEERDSGAAAVVCDAAQLEATLTRLNRKGVREVRTDICSRAWSETEVGSKHALDAAVSHRQEVSTT